MSDIDSLKMIMGLPVELFQMVHSYLDFELFSNVETVCDVVLKINKYSATLQLPRLTLQQYVDSSRERKIDVLSRALEFFNAQPRVLVQGPDGEELADPFMYEKLIFGFELDSVRASL